MELCDYGCGQEAKHQLKNGKWCCSKNYRSCLGVRNKNSGSQKGKILSSIHKKKIGNAHCGKIHSEETKRKISKSMKGKMPGNKGISHSEETRRKMKYTLKDYKEKYPFFYRIEELKETKDGEIQVHCKNHNCKNSKEKGGWFTVTKIQLVERIRALEKPHGMIESNFYCSQECKDTCPLYGLKSDPFKNNNLPHTPGEYQTFRTFVLERDDYICQFCGKKATHVHHELPQKLEPFHTLDPDYAWSCCKKCHYKKGHQGECSTGNLAKIVCSVESQKFLNQLEELK